MLPPPALAIIRYHSFYPWHTQNGYCHLTNAHDEEMKKWYDAEPMLGSVP